jgi:hypothetical protein
MMDESTSLRLGHTRSVARKLGVSNRIVFGSDMVIRARKYIEIGRGEIHLVGVVKQARPVACRCSAVGRSMVPVRHHTAHARLHLRFAGLRGHDALRKLPERTCAEPRLACCVRINAQPRGRRPRADQALACNPHSRSAWSTFGRPSCRFS